VKHKHNCYILPANSATIPLLMKIGTQPNNPALATSSACHLGPLGSHQQHAATCPQVAAPTHTQQHRCQVLSTPSIPHRCRCKAAPPHPQHQQQAMCSGSGHSASQPAHHCPLQQLPLLLLTHTAVHPHRLARALGRRGTAHRSANLPHPATASCCWR
jgi:hypothetical protein